MSHPKRIKATDLEWRPERECSGPITELDGCWFPQFEIWFDNGEGTYGVMVEDEERFDVGPFSTIQEAKQVIKELVIDWLNRKMKKAAKIPTTVRSKSAPSSKHTRRRTAR